MRKHKLQSLLILGILFSLLGCLRQDSERVFWSPYQEVNWDKVGHYDSEFHTHTNLGKYEQYDPHQTIDRYYKEGYQILTLSNHDYDIPVDYMTLVYPWTELASIYETIKNIENPLANSKSYSQLANEPWQDRDPVELNMIAVQGCEISAPHHVISLFNPLNKGAETEDETFGQIEQLGGIAYFAHPGRYVKGRGLTAEWYVAKYQKFNCLIGQAIYNRKDSHPGDRELFDKIAHILGHQRPIWLFGEDDMHYEVELGWNRDVILLQDFRPGSLHPDIPDGSAADVKQALIKGHTYLWKPSEQYNRRAFTLQNVDVDPKHIILTIDNEAHVTQIRWRTHNPITGTTETIHKGNSISMDDVPGYSNFIRAEIEGGDDILSQV
jgi:hypothetical protein